MTENANVDQGDLEKNQQKQEPSSSSDKNVQQTLKRVIGQRDKARQDIEINSEVNQDLLQKNAALQREIEIYKKSGGAAAPTEVGQKPTLESCGGDTKKLETELDRFYQAKVQAERQEQAKAEQQDQEFNASVDSHYERAEKLGLPDYEQAEVNALASLGSQIIEGITAKISNSEQLIYMLGTDTKEALRLKALFAKDPAAATIEIGRLSALAVSYKNNNVADPEAHLNSGGSSVGELSRLERELDAAYEEAAKTGDLSGVKEVKKRIKASKA